MSGRSYKTEHSHCFCTAWLINVVQQGVSLHGTMNVELQNLGTEPSVRRGIGLFQRSEGRPPPETPHLRTTICYTKECEYYRDVAIPAASSLSTKLPQFMQ
jgi:hypothetical protein